MRQPDLESHGNERVLDGPVLLIAAITQVLHEKETDTDGQRKDPKDHEWAWRCAWARVAHPLIVRIAEPP
jgi:hypothetical protein